MVFRMVFLHPIHTGKLNHLRLNQVMLRCILIGQSNNRNPFDWLKYNMKNKAGISVSIRIIAVENIVYLCKACTYIRTLLRTF